MRIRNELLAALLLMRCCLPVSAHAAGSLALLEVVIDGQDTDQVCAFEIRNGQPWAKVTDLTRLGFVLSAAQQGPVQLATLPGVTYRIDSRQQIIEIQVYGAALRPIILDARNRAPDTPLSPAGSGLVLNYNGLLTVAGGDRRNDGGTTGGFFIGLRGLSPYGVFDSTSLVQLNPPIGQDTLQRLDNTYTYADPDTLLRWRAGDVISGALDWSRAVRLTGLQVGTDFDLRPDLITYPLPQFGGDAAVPSAVDLLVDGNRVFSQNVSPGPFQLLSLPRIDGAGNAVVTVTNALGQQVTTTTPFYITPSLLRAGLASYSLEAGAVRTNYATAFDRYAGLGWSGSVRYGLTDWLTVESHAEGTSSLALAGAGLAARVGQIGVVNLSAAGSAGGRQNGFEQDSPGTGGTASIGFQRQTRRYSFAVAASHATAGYHDIAALYGTAMPHDTLTANLSLNLARLGALDVSYIRQSDWSAALAFGQSPITALSYGLFDQTRHAAQVNVSYTVPLTQTTSFFATAYKDLLNRADFGATFGLTVYFGGVSADAVDQLQDGRPTPEFDADKPVVAPGDLGFTLHDAQGEQTYRTAELNYLSGWGEATVGAAQTPTATAGRIGLQGALVMIDDRVFAADRIADSFAVVSSGDVPDVRVTYENRPAGRTDADGLLLVPELQSYHDNLLALDPDDLPPDAAAQTMRLTLRPRDQSYVFADFGVRYDNPAVLRILMPDGKPATLGGVVTLPGGGPIVIGYDGEAYVTGLTPHNHATVTLPDGKFCHIDFNFSPVKGKIQTIGPLPCN